MRMSVSSATDEFRYQFRWLRNRIRNKYWTTLGGANIAYNAIERYKVLQRPSYFLSLSDDIFQRKEFKGKLLGESPDYIKNECIDYVYHLTKPCHIEPESGYTIMDPGIIIPQSLAWSFFAHQREKLKIFHGIPSISGYRKACRNEVPVINQSVVISLRHIFQFNYGHCLIQMMPALRLLEEVGVSREIPIVVPVQLASQSFFQEMIQRGSLRGRRWIVQDKEYIRAKEVIFARVEWPSRQLLNDSLDDINAPYGKPNPTRRLFIMRKNRNIANFQVVLPEIERHGFECIRPEELTLSEQMELFSQAAILCGTTGAALTNAVFARGNQLKLLEISPIDWKHLFFYRLAKVCGFDHRFLFASTFDGNKHKDITVDPDAFKSFLADAVSSVSHTSIITA